MYIAPNTNVKVLHNVPLDNTYDHTLYFADAADQSYYFTGLVKYNLTNYTYQRVNKGAIRVEGKADDYYDCNYMMFQNTSFGTKWFYAFITSVEYINNQTTEITYEIDVMQTWLFDAHVEECFIERQHSLSDAIGDNIVPETLTTGEYVFNDYAPVYVMNSMLVVIAIVDVDGGSSGTLYDGIYGSAELYAYDSTDVTNINSKLDEYAQKPDAIISMYMMPKILLPNIPADHKILYAQNATPTAINNISAISKNMTLDGYTPKNGKMYTYPFSYYHVDNGAGQELSLRYEFFHNLKPILLITGNITQPVTVDLRPCGYKGLPAYSSLAGYTTLNTEALQISSYPICSWNVDSYQAWIAQNSLPLALNATSQLGNTLIASQYSAHPDASVISGSIGIAANLLSQIYTASIQADISRGNFNNGGVNVANGKQHFYGGRVSVSYQYAKMIDDFFTMYGYAVKAIGRINTHARPHWNYVKTVGCCVTGSMPGDDLQEICRIYDRGITFWRHGNEVGNYSLDNSLS